MELYTKCDCHRFLAKAAVERTNIVQIMFAPHQVSDMVEADWILEPSIPTVVFLA